MNLLLLDPLEIRDNNTVCVDDVRTKHIIKILKKGPGDSLRTGIIGGATGTAIITDINQKGITLEIHCSNDTAPPPPIDLILALPRPIMLKRILTQLAPLGVARLFLIRSDRVEKSFFQSTLLGKEEYTKPLRLGMEQAMETWQPEIYIIKWFRQFINETLPQYNDLQAVHLIAHPETEDTLATAVHLPLRQRAMIAIGPEGGWIPFEVEQFSLAGFKPFHLGKRIMRVDTAIPVALGQLDLLRSLSQPKIS